MSRANATCQPRVFVATFHASAPARGSTHVLSRRLNSSEDSRELLDVPLAEPFEQVGADGGEVRRRSFEQSFSPGVGSRDTRGARVGSVAVPGDKAVALELHRQSRCTARAQPDALG